MSLDKLRQDWDSLAERDALWAILTDQTKVGGKWDVAQFMTTGDTEIQTVLSYLARVNCVPNFNGAALDFGCGVGRLTQAMAQHFASCVGIDISSEMIQRADALNRFEHCRYAASSDSRLPFDDAGFSFVYSNIVLQHMPSRFAKQYLREFVRLLAPGGVLVFGVQDSFAVRDVSSVLTRIRQLVRIRSRIKSALNIGWRDMQMHCLAEHEVRDALGSARVVDIQFTNTSAKDFNGNLIYLQRAPASGFISKQYCVVKSL